MDGKKAGLICLVVVVSVALKASAQNECDALLQFGIRNYVIMESSEKANREFHNDILSIELSSASDQTIAHIQAKYAQTFKGSADMTRNQIETYQKIYREQTGSKDFKEDLQKYSASFIDPHVLNSYNQCLTLQKDLKITPKFMNDFNDVDIDIAFKGSGTGHVLNDIIVTPVDGFSCSLFVSEKEGGGVRKKASEVKSLTLTPNAITINCRRTSHPVKVGNESYPQYKQASISLSTNSGSYVLDFPKVPAPSMTLNRIKEFEEKQNQTELEMIRNTPPGTIIAYAGDEIPPGWLVCDGKAVSRKDFERLFNAINTAWGAGDGKKTFNLPDLRGNFLRGVDAGAGHDPNRADRKAINPGGNTGDKVGSFQPDEFKAHTHGVRALQAIPGDHKKNVKRDADGYAPTFPTESAGGKETRPRNVNVVFLIKY